MALNVNSAARFVSDHAPTDSDFDNVGDATDGIEVVDIENAKLWYRCKGVWVGVALS